jgi:hypothetical protein
VNSKIVSCARCIRRCSTDNVLWICWFTNASIDAMEHQRHDSARSSKLTMSAPISLSPQSENGPRGAYLGMGQEGPVWAGPQRSTLVLGPPRSGKTSSLVIPNVLAAEGPVVSTST